MDHQRRPLWLSAGCLLAFVVILALVSVDSPLTALDEHVRNHFLTHQNATLRDLATAVTDVFSPLADALVLAAGAGYLAFTRRRTGSLVAVALTGWLMALVVVGTKHALGRPPPVPVTATHGSSFPSGHTAATLVCLGALALLVARERPQWTRPALIAVGTVTFAVVAALVYANFHWLSDTLGSIALGVGLLVPLQWWLSRRP